MRSIPLVLADATVTLYPADAAGHPVCSEPVWIGARVEGLAIESELEQVESTPSGAPGRQWEPGPESHKITIDRIWVIGTDARRAFALARGKFVLDVLHENRRSGTYHRLVFYGVSMVRDRIQSRGIMEYAEGQEFRAELRTEEAGELPASVIRSVLPNVPAILFTLEGALVANVFLLGAYSFDRAVRLTWAYAVAKAGAGGVTVLRLMKDGVATAYNISLAAGSGEASGTSALDLVVPAASVLRWKVESAPGSSQASKASVAVNLEAA